MAFGGVAQDRVIDSIHACPIAMAVSDPRLPDNPLVAVNAAFLELTGYREPEVLGRNCRFLSGAQTEPGISAILRAAIHERRPVLAQIVNHRKDGSPFLNGVMIAPLFDEGGALRYFLGSQVDLGSGAGSLAERHVAAEARVAQLPQRQRQVLQAMGEGLLNKQIAARLAISEKTVKMHRSLMIERLGVRTSAEAIRVAVEAGL